MQTQFLHKKSVSECGKFGTLRGIMADSKPPNTSLQKMPPSLLPEKAPEQAISTMDASSIGEVSYARLLLDYALQQTREHNKMELKAGLIAALITGALVGGVTLGNLFLSGVAFLLTLITLFFLHLFHSASALDKERRKEIFEKQGQIKQLAKDLEDERTKPELKGIFHQVYIDDVHLSDYIAGDSEVGFFVTVQVSMWNVRKTPTSVIEFSLRVFTGMGEMKGAWVTGGGYAYFKQGTLATKFQETIYPLDVWELSRSPLPDGYTQGIVERERWLRFKVTSFSLLEEFFKTLDEWQSQVQRIDLLATDSFGIEHEVASIGPPWPTKGKIDLQSIEQDKEWIIGFLTSFSNSGGELYSRCMSGESSERIEADIRDWEKRVAAFLEENFDSAHRAVFINAPIDVGLLAGRTARQSHLVKWMHIRLQKLNEIIERERNR